LLDLSRRELVVILPLVIGIVWLGLYPAPVLRRMERSTQRYLEMARPPTMTPGSIRLGGTLPEGTR